MVVEPSFVDSIEYTALIIVDRLRVLLGPIGASIFRLELVAITQSDVISARR